GTMLIQSGTLRTGDIVVAGAAWGKVRALVADNGARVEEAGPSEPVELLGLNQAPSAGDEFTVVDSEGRAREIVEYRQRKERDRINTPVAKSLDQLMSQLKEGERKEVPVLVKADVQGSSEAIIAALEKMGTDEVAVRVLHAGVGGVTESDVTLCSASDAPILAFNVRANAPARQMAERDQVEIRYYNVIYDLVDDIKAVMEGMLAPTLRETFLGNAEILQVFNITKTGRVAGCRISEGMAKRSAKVRLIRDSVVIHEGTLSTLRRFKDEVKEVHAGQECGMAFENYQDIQVGDVIEIYEVETIARTLDA
ncbi:MAG TPA: translation initiation factor IF-2, partial [Alphaproteobacteria bacterium]|nr:translation initiation factor IF-2 [Alphaproteobacteria bacterium]